MVDWRKLIPTKWHKDFQALLDGGNPSKAFGAWFNSSTEAQAVVNYIFRNDDLGQLLTQAAQEEEIDGHGPQGPR